MKKIFLLFSIVLMLVVLLGADIRRKKEASLMSVVGKKKPCYGYTIVEFGKGIDCNGDTVKLVKVKGGGQALAPIQP
jgi:hypothetical protein